MKYLLGVVKLESIVELRRLLTATCHDCRCCIQVTLTQVVTSNKTTSRCRKQVPIWQVAAKNTGSQFVLWSCNKLKSLLKTAYRNRIQKPRLLGSWSYQNSVHKNSLAIRSKIIAKERESRPIKSALISSYEKEMLVSWEWKVCVCVCWSLFQSITTQLAPTSIQKLFARVTLSSQARMVQKPSNSIKQMLWSQQVLARDCVNLFLLWIGAFYPRPNRMQKHINNKKRGRKTFEWLTCGGK